MYILFDIGGTKTRLARSKDGHSYENVIKFDTPSNVEDALRKIGEETQILLEGSTPTYAAGGIAGPLNRDRSELGNAPHLPHWRGVPIKRRLEEIFSAPTLLENDSAVVGLGEAWNGSGKGHRIVTYVTISTGVGGARIIDGHIDKSSYGFEPGHQIIDIDGSLCQVCHAVEAEGLLSGTATEIRFRKKAYEITDPHVWEELSLWLAVVVNNSIVHWSPDVVVLGGSMIVGNPAIPVDRVRYHLEKILTIYPSLPLIVPAALADEGGLYGALALLQARGT